MTSKIVYGKYVVKNAGTVIPSGAIYVEDDTIIQVGTYAEMTRKYAADRIIGSVDHLVIPGLVNAHGHGKGITDFQRGAIDDTLETWKFRMYPPIDGYFDTLWTAIQLLESGVTTTMHNHNLSNPDAYEEEFSTTVGAYGESGIRLAFAPSLADRNIFVYGDNESFVQSLPDEVRKLCRAITSRMQQFGQKEYFDAVDTLKTRLRSDRVEILHGPMAPQWVDTETLREIKRHADQNGMRIHIHTLQTQLQKLYGLKTYGKSLLAYLEGLGFLGKNVTCGHCVWVSDDDISILADTGASVTHHVTCNLRVRNGISPVSAMLDKGIIVAIGMDDKELGDNKDFIEEMRMVSKLHRLSSHRLASAHLSPKTCFRMGTEWGAEVLGFSDRIGDLAAGKKADMVLLDMRRMTEPFVSPDHDIIDILMYRGRAVDVDTVLVGGEILLQNQKLTRLDRQEVIHRLMESIPPDYAKRFQKANRLFPALRESVAAYFDPWYKEMDVIEKSPYYFMNNKI